MRTLTKFVLIAVFALGFVPALAQTAKSKEKTVAEIKQGIIAASIASYSGSCPCPYNTDRGGRRCGGRSAYSRKGGASPLCYDSDVTDKMVQDYRQRNARK